MLDFHVRSNATAMGYASYRPFKKHIEDDPLVEDMQVDERGADDEE